MFSSELYQKKQEELQDEYNLLNEKIGRLRKAKIIETDPATCFKLEKQIEEAEGDLEQLQQQLEELENKGQIDGTRPGVSFLWNVPYPRNPYFTGREEILNNLHNKLRSNKATALSQQQAISGLGGIGKTQTAVEYAYRYRDEYDAIFWVTADSSESLISSFVNIAGLLNLPEKDAENQNIAVAAVQRWLDQNDDWLLIFDNADDPELLKDFILRDLRGWVLLTSRAQAFDNLYITDPVELEKLNPIEAHTFLLKRTRRCKPEPAEIKAIEQLAHELDYLPLALEQAGAYIYKMQSSFQNYLSGYRKRGVKLLKNMKSVAGKYPKSVLTTWSLNFKQVRQISPAAADLLHVSAFLYPDRVPLEIITSGAGELGSELSEVLADIETDPLILNELLQPLTQYSLIYRNPSETFDIHRLVQAVIRETMGDSERKEWAERAVKAVNRTFPIVEFSEWSLCERLLSHAQTCAVLIETWGFEFGEAIRLLDQTGIYLYKRARYTEAESLYKQALQTQEKTLGAEHPNIAQSLNRLALIYRAQGRYHKAEPLYKQALAIREKALGTEHPNLAVSLNNLGLLYEKQGKYTEAEALYQRALAILEKALGIEHPYVANGLNNLGLLYFTQGKYTEAEPLYQQALAIREKTLGSEHPDVATSLNNLAALYHAQGKYAEAEPLCKRSLEIRVKVLGPEHPDVAFSLNILAERYRARGEYPEAEPLYKRALTIREKALGVEHPLFALSLNNLALLYDEQGRYGEAEPLFKQALAIREKALGAAHPDVATTLENYATLLDKMNRKVEAIELEARASAIRSQYTQKSLKK